MTNLDYIKNMKADEMADFIIQIAYYEDDTTPMVGLTIDNRKALRCCKEEITKWLLQEKE